MLETLTLDSFAGLAGETFALSETGDRTLPLDLVEARSLASAGTAAEGSRRAREPFSLVFKGPAAPVLPQRIYRLEHARLGALELFLVPIGRDPGGSLLYEAIFT